MAEDHHIVENRIAKNAADACQHGQMGLLGALDGGGVHAVDGGEQIARRYDAQVLNRHLKAFAGGQEAGHHLPGKQHAYRGEQRRHDQGKAQGQPHGPAQPFDIPRAPILAHENGAARAGAEAEQIEHEGKAVGLGHGGIGRVAQRGHHQSVHDMQRAFHQRLHHHGQGYQKDVAGKWPVPAKAIPEEAPQPGGGRTYCLHKGSFRKEQSKIAIKSSSQE